MKHEVLEKARRRPDWWPSDHYWWGVLAAVMVAGVAASLLAYLLVADLEHTRASAEFGDLADDRLEEINRNVRGALSGLSSIYSLFAASSYVTGSEFQTFVKPLLTGQSALVAAFWAPRVEDSERPSFEQRAQLEGHPGYVILQSDPSGGTSPRTQASEYCPILYFQPTDLSPKFTGLDLLSDPLYAYVVAQSTRHKGQAATRPLRIPGKPDTLGYVVLQPVYGRLPAGATGAYAPENIAGFVGAVIHTGELLRAGPRDVEAAQVKLVIYDVSEPFQALLWSPSVEDTQLAELLTANGGKDIFVKRRLAFADRAWEVTAIPSATFLADNQPWISHLVLVLGLLATVGMVLYAWLLQTRAALARQHARETEELLGRLQAETEARSRVEEQLRQTQKLEAIGRLAGGIAHDFNNLLTVILGNIELLLLRPAPEPELTEIKKSAELAAALTKKLLAFSRQQPRQVKVFRLDEEVLATKDLLQRLLGDHLELVVTVRSDAMDKKSESTLPLLPWVEMDPSQLQQILMNLVINAGDSMPEGGVIQVTVAMARIDENQAARPPDLKAGWYALLEVADSGHGMDADTLSHIFEPFFTTKEEGRGTGLGLATVYGIVKQNKGHIEAFSTPGVGSTFRIYLPLAARTPESPAAPAENAVTQTAPLRVLVVEDNEAVRRLAVRILKSAGYDVWEVADARQAIELVKSSLAGLELLLTDVTMPGMTGQQLARQLEALAPGLRVVYMSGFDKESTLAEETDRPVFFVQKPFTSQSLLAEISRCLNTPAT